MTIAPVGSGSLNAGLVVVLVLVVLDLAVGGLVLGLGGGAAFALRRGARARARRRRVVVDEIGLVEFDIDVQLDVVVELVDVGLVGAFAADAFAVRFAAAFAGGGRLRRSRLRGGRLRGAVLAAGFAAGLLDRLLGGRLRLGVLRAAARVVVFVSEVTFRLSPADGVSHAPR